MIMEESQTVIERIRELNKKKKKLMGRIRKSKKAQIKARLEKKKISEEIQSLRGKRNLFVNMTAEEAGKFVKGKIESVGPDDIFPKKLEREFDKVDMAGTGNKNTKTLDLGNISSKAPTKERAVKVDEDEHDTIEVSGNATETDDGSATFEGQDYDAQDSPDKEDGVIDLSDQ